MNDKLNFGDDLCLSVCVCVGVCVSLCCRSGRCGRRSTGSWAWMASGLSVPTPRPWSPSAGSPGTRRSASPKSKVASWSDRRRRKWAKRSTCTRRWLEFQSAFAKSRCSWTSFYNWIAKPKRAISRLHHMDIVPPSAVLKPFCCPCVADQDSQ